MQEHAVPLRSKADISQLCASEHFNTHCSLCKCAAERMCVGCVLVPFCAKELTTLMLMQAAPTHVCVRARAHMHTNTTSPCKLYLYEWELEERFAWWILSSRPCVLKNVQMRNAPKRTPLFTNMLMLHSLYLNTGVFLYFLTQ